MTDNEEQVDIVDEECNVLFSTSKADAHAKGLLHRTVIAEIRDSKGNWILVKQASDRQDAGQYVSPVGGHVQVGETEEGALKREALEEVGFTDFKYKLVGRAIFYREVLGRKENHYFVLFEIESDEKFVLGEEAVDFEFFSEAELAKQLIDNPKKFGNAFFFVLKTFYPGLLKSREMTPTETPASANPLRIRPQMVKKLQAGRPH